MILDVRKSTNECYRHGTLSCLVFEVLWGMEIGSEIVIEKIKSGEIGIVDFQKFRIALSRVCKSQPVEARTKIIDGKLHVYRIK